VFQLSVSLYYEFLIMMVKKIIGYLKLTGILMYNSLIILARQFIHTCRFTKVRPLFFVFYEGVNFV